MELSGLELKLRLPIGTLLFFLYLATKPNWNLPLAVGSGR